MALSAGLSGFQEARAELPPYRPGTIHVRPFVGLSAIGMEGLDSYPDKSVISWITKWRSLGMSVTQRDERGISWALIEGVEAEYQLDEQVSVSARFGYLVTEKGIRRTVLEGGGDRYEDVWTTQGEMLLCQAGTGFNAGLSEKVRLSIALFVGAGFASVSLERRMTFSPSAIDEFVAAGTGVAFMPEFTLRFDYMIRESLSFGWGLGYRFGSVGSFEHRHATAITDAVTLDNAGTTVRDFWGNMLESDYGGPYLELSFAGHF